MAILTTEQKDILRAHVDAGDRIAYYTALASFGEVYGALALGVVLNNTQTGDVPYTLRNVA
ncbi:MAG: hypothetical protein ACRCSU_02430 [Paracoccaceae bacterium]